ncbi:MAG: T9SS type A sorting domain-containing protein [Bacteroidia bacterium]|nr:T9SS type A sorting domain-containing protein [Bacteroidia bacterium]
MKITLYIILSAIFTSIISFGQIYSGPIPKPTSGYGSDGSYTVATQSFSNPNYPAEDIRIYYPLGISSSVPTIFYSHGFGGYQPVNIMGLLNFVAKKGYAIVFVPYQTSSVTNTQRYNNLLSGFIKSARDFPSIIDTTKVGFMGHSFGGGATFANANHCFTNLNWGLSGRFMFASAQWYSLNISQTELLNFPSDVKLLTMVYENDSTNDHRMANDIFNTINIPSSEKDFLLVKSDTISSYTYDAIHGLPNTASSFDALDYYAIYRHLDALCDYTFNGSLAGKDVALGNGSPNQISMPGGMKNLVQSDTPNFSHPQNFYTYPCSSIQNPRQSYCNNVTSIIETSNYSSFSIFPNPANSILNINTELEISKMELFNIQGLLVKTANTKSIQIIDLPNGLYLVKVTFIDNSVVINKVIKE